MTRQLGNRSMAVLALAILAAVMIGAFDDETTLWLRDLTRPGDPSAPDPVPVAGAKIAGTATVIDGDTLEIHDQRIRLFGIDAPESGQTCTDANGTSYRCGQRAALALADRIGRKPVACEHHGTDRYGRIIAICRQGAVDLNLWMVANGHALAYRRYSTDYAAQEDMARHNKRGLWAGNFVPPWDWRKGQR